MSKTIINYWICALQNAEIWNDVEQRQQQDTDGKTRTAMDDQAGQLRKELSGKTISYQQAKSFLIFQNYSRLLSQTSNRHNIVYIA